MALNVSVNMAKLEVCVESVESARNAIRGGAARLELCSSLSLGGLTPSVGLLRVVKRECGGVPVFVMIRPREGDFDYDDDEIEVMQRDIEVCSRHGADGFVFGLLNATGHVNREACRRLVAAAHPLPCTFHRAFDVLVDPWTSLETIIQLGFRRVLTSGLKPTAERGVPMIKQLRSAAGDRIVIMAGAGVTEVNAAKIVAETCVTEIHGSASEERPITTRVNSVKMGTQDEIDRRRITSQRIVQNIVGAICPT